MAEDENVEPSPSALSQHLIEPWVLHDDDDRCAACDILFTWLAGYEVTAICRTCGRKVFKVCSNDLRDVLMFVEDPQPHRPLVFCNEASAPHKIVAVEGVTEAAYPDDEFRKEDGDDDPFWSAPYDPEED